MAEFTGADLRGSRFEQVDLTGARFRNVDLTGAQIRGALLVDLELDGEVDNLRINDVDVGPLIEAELDRRYPERAKLRGCDADGFREAWAVIERSWSFTGAGPSSRPGTAARTRRRRMVVHRDASSSPLRDGRLGEADDPR